MKLSDYLTWKSITPETFAARLKVDVVTVRRYLRGTRRPRWGVMDRIVTATDGMVTANDFAPGTAKPEAPKKRKRPKSRVPRSKEAELAA